MITDVYVTLIGRESMEVLRQLAKMSRRWEMPPEEVAAMERSQVQQGSVLIAKQLTRACDFADIGVCFESYETGRRKGWSIIFESGRWGGFTHGEIEQWFHVTNRRAGYLRAYLCEGAEQLNRDHRAGVFGEAFAIGRLLMDSQLFQATGT